MSDEINIGQFNQLKGAIDKILEENGLTGIEGYDILVLPDGTLGIEFIVDIKPDALLSIEERETEAAFADMVANFDGPQEAPKPSGPKITEADRSEIEEAERFWKDFD